MQTISAFVGLGANLGDPRAQLAAARDRLLGLPMVAGGVFSDVYWTEPFGIPQGEAGNPEQPWYANQVGRLDVRGNTTPQALLEVFLEIEQALGRVRGAGDVRFGPRLVDIDLLMLGDEVSNDPGCIVPHPRMLERAFVLVPLAQIAPDCRIPVPHQAGEEGTIPLLAALHALEYEEADGRITQRPIPKEQYVCGKF